jgi:hypothetical protein
MSLFGNSSTPTGTDHVRPQSEGDRDLARTLALLEGDQAGSITVAALRNHGVKAPAQAVYELQLAGYAIDRVRFKDPQGRKTLAYRLASAPAPDGLAAAPESIAQEQTNDHLEANRAWSPDTLGSIRRAQRATHPL